MTKPVLSNEEAQREVNEIISRVRKLFPQIEGGKVLVRDKILTTKLLEEIMEAHQRMHKNATQG